MAERRSPNLARRRRLAVELRRLRERAGLTGDEVASTLEWRSRSKLSRIEQGSSGLKQADLESLLALYNVSSAHREELLVLAEESRKSGPLHATRTRLPEEYIAFLEEEADADSIRIWESQIVPGLFQIENYTRAILRAWVNTFSDPAAEVDRRVEARRLRQEVLTRDPPPRVTAVIDESVLHRKIGKASVMSEQLEYMMTISEMPNVEIRVVPLSVGHVIVPGPFNYLQFPHLHDVPLNDKVSVETLTGMEYVEGEEDINRYLVAFKSLEEVALSMAETRKLISSIANANRAQPGS